MNKQKFLLTLLSLLMFIGANAKRNFYHRIDVGTSNIYTFVLSNIATGFANYYSRDILFDNSYVYTLYSGDIKTKGLNPMGVTARDLFNYAFAGVKLGYHSESLSSFNWGLYASAHYRINQVDAKTKNAEGYHIERFQYLKPGAGILLTFGGVESDLIVQFEAAARFDMPINYKGMFGSETDCLKSGLSSHYSLKFAGNKAFSIGAFLDLTHYNLYKDNDLKMKPISFGAIFTITPKRGIDVYGY